MILKRANSPLFFACSLPFAVACALAGCSDTGATDNDAGVSDAGAQSLSFTVVEAESTDTAIVGAMAYAQYKDGTDEHTLADASGKVTFTSPGLASGIDAVSVGTTKRTVHTMVEPDVSALDGKAVALELLRPPTFTLSGPLNPMVTGDSILMQPTLSPAVGNFSANNVTATAKYSLQVPPNVLFSVYGSEFQKTQTQFTRGFDINITKWFHFDHPGLTSNTTFALDLTALPSDTPVTANGTLYIPGGDLGPLGGASTALVLVLGDAGHAPYAALPNIGTTTSIKISSDNSSFQYAVEYVPYTDVKPFIFAQIAQVDGSYSFVSIPGFPTVGQTINGLAIPVALAGPLAEGSEIDATVATAGQTVMLATNQSGVNSGGRADLWDVTLPPGKVSKVPVLAAELKALLCQDCTAGFSAVVQVYTGDASSVGTLTTSRSVAMTP